MFVAIHYDKPMFEFNTYLANITSPDKPYEIFKEMDFLVSIGSSLNNTKRQERPSMDSFGGMGSLGSMSSKGLDLTDEEIEAMMKGE
jgi:hypothetical protein